MRHNGFWKSGKVVEKSIKPDFKMMFNLFKSNMTLKRIFIAGKQLKTLLRDKKR